jgi:hypothetical protein
MRLRQSKPLPPRWQRESVEKNFLLNRRQNLAQAGFGNESDKINARLFEARDDFPG